MELEVVGSDSTISVSDSTFGREFNEALVHQAVAAYLAGGRGGTKAQKNRSEVRGGGAKPWRQKGTGRARVGTIRSPLWRGGGVAFAARPRYFGLKLNKKMYRGAMRSLVSELARQGRLVIVDDFSLDTPRTRELLAKLRKLSLKAVLIVTAEADKRLYLAARNVQNVDVTEVGGLDPVSLIRFDNVLMTVAAVKQIEDWLA